MGLVWGVKPGRFMPILMSLNQILSLTWPKPRPSHNARYLSKPLAARTVGALLVAAWMVCWVASAAAQTTRSDQSTWVQFPPRNPLAGWAQVDPPKTASPAPTTANANGPLVSPSKVAASGMENWVRYPPASLPEGAAVPLDASIQAMPPTQNAAAQPNPLRPDPQVTGSRKVVNDIDQMPEDMLLPHSVDESWITPTPTPTPKEVLEPVPQPVQLTQPAPAPAPAPQQAQAHAAPPSAPTATDTASDAETKEVMAAPAASAQAMPAQVSVSEVKGNPYRFDLSWDNAGEVSTGLARTLGRFTMENQLGMGERVGYDAMYSSGLARMRYFYDQGMGQWGWRLGGFYQAAQYQFLPQSYSALGVLQPSASGGLTLTSALPAGDVAGRAWSVSLERRRFRQETASGWLDSYGSEVAQAQWTLTHLYRRAQLTLDAGKLDLAGSARQISDAQAEQTEGNFAKARWSLTSQWARSDNWFATVSWQGQWASKNLDPSERFGLGGPQGVRAYSVGEGAGSQAQLWRLEWVAPNALTGPGAQVAAFWDAGRTRRLKFKADDATNWSNDGDLYAAGLWVSGQWQGPAGPLSWHLTWARRLGDNPWADAWGRDPDGSQGRDRWWFQAVQPF